MTEEEALERNKRLIAAQVANKAELHALLDQIQKLFPGIALTLVLRDPVVPPFVACSYGVTDDYALFAKGLLLSALGLRNRSDLGALAHERKEFAE